VKRTHLSLSKHQKLFLVLSFIIHWNVIQFCGGCDNDEVDLWKEQCFDIGLAICSFFLCLVPIGIGDGARLVDNENLKISLKS
jgi:hypothetical protein